MKKMRSLVVSDYPEIIAYGCGAHMLNLLAKGLHPSDVVKKTVCIKMSKMLLSVSGLLRLL